MASFARKYSLGWAIQTKHIYAFTTNKQRQFGITGMVVSRIDSGMVVFTHRFMYT